MSLIGQIRGTVEAVVREILADVVAPLLDKLGERINVLEDRVKRLEDQIPDPGKKTAPVANATRAKAGTATAKGSSS